MAREFSDAEFAVFGVAEKELQDRGLDLFGTSANQNAGILMKFFEDNPTLPVTLQQFHAVVDTLRDTLTWRSPAWKQWDQLSRQHPAKAVAVTRWIVGGAKTQGVPQESGLRNDVENALNLLKELLTFYGSVDFAVTTETMWQAIYRIQSRGMVRLHFGLEKKVDTANHKMGVMFDKATVNRSFVDVVKQSRPAEFKPAAPTPEQVAEAEAEKQARSIARDGRHSDQAELTAIMNRERNRSASWQQTLAVMQQVQADRRRSRNRGETLIGQVG